MLISKYRDLINYNNSLLISKYKDLLVELLGNFHGFFFISNFHGILSELYNKHH